ncbi:MAG: hypothetical protein AB1576_03915 [Bacillota bacterium]
MLLQVAIQMALALLMTCTVLWLDHCRHPFMPGTGTLSPGFGEGAGNLFANPGGLQGTGPKGDSLRDCRDQGALDRISL